MTESSLVIKHDNNFDALRIFAALCVIFAHNFNIYGLPEPIILKASDHYRVIAFGILGVSVFFTISGYLIAQSLCSTSSLKNFAIRRVARIYPGYLVNLFFIVVIFAPFISKLSVWEYFYSATNIHSSRFLKALLIFKVPELPGVFTENHDKNLVNPPLWTMWWEVRCYFVIAFLYWWQGGFDKKTFFLIPLSLIIFNIFLYPPIPEASDASIYCTLFALGACYYIYKDFLKLKITYFLFLTAIMVAMVVFNSILIPDFSDYIIPLYMLVISYIVIFIGLFNNWLKVVGKYGDFSYGLYIYAWPIQQQVAFYYKFDQVNFIPFCIVNLVATLIMAMLSWHFVEKPVLRMVRAKTTKNKSLH